MGVFELDWWDESVLAVQSAVVERVDVLRDGDLEVVDILPRPFVADQCALNSESGGFRPRLATSCRSDRPAPAGPPGHRSPPCWDHFTSLEVLVVPSIGQLDVEILGKLTQNARAALAAGLGVSRSNGADRARTEVPAEVLEVRIQAGREDLLVHVAIGSLDELQVLTAAIVEIDGVRPTTSTFTVATPIPYRVQPLLNEVTQGCEIGPLDARPTLGGPARPDRGSVPGQAEPWSSRATRGSRSSSGTYST